MKRYSRRSSSASLGSTGREINIPRIQRWSTWVSWCLWWIYRVGIRGLFSKTIQSEVGRHLCWSPQPSFSKAVCCLATSYQVNSCAGCINIVYALHYVNPSTKSSKHSLLFPFYIQRNWSSQRSSNLPMTKQLVYGNVRVQVHDDSLP